MLKPLAAVWAGCNVFTPFDLWTVNIIFFDDNKILLKGNFVINAAAGVNYNT